MLDETVMWAGDGVGEGALPLPLPPSHETESWEDLVPFTAAHGSFHGREMSGDVGRGIEPRID